LPWSSFSWFMRYAPATPMPTTAIFIDNLL
jgi:hypothetical protein